MAHQPGHALQQPPQQQHPAQQAPTSSQRLNAVTEEVWLQIGSLSENMNDQERALSAYDNALRHNPYSQAALTQIANIYRSREDFDKAVEFFQRIVNADSTNGEIWGAIGNCYLMLDELPKAYQAYQQAIIHLPNPKEPKLWYGIGILYDRYGSYEHAEEAFVAVMNMDPTFDKATEIYFRLGIIHKCQGKYPQSLECFNRILNDPPKPLTETDIWFQIGNVHELNSEFTLAKDAYERVLRENPQHTKVLQQLGALYFRPNTILSNIDAAVQLLTSAIELDKDKAEAQTWYLLGRCYMLQQQYNKAYEAYQQAVYRDGNNANYWCSIGVLYYQINQYRDALDAYSRAIRINPYLSEVWFDLGALYEACNNQVNDAIDAYTRAAELDRSNPIIDQRLDLLRRIQGTGQTSLGSANPPPAPIDPPTATATAGQPNAPGGPAGEAAVAGGAPGVLGAPPMSGAPVHPQEHAPHAGEAPLQPPGAAGGMRGAQQYGHQPRPLHAQPHHSGQAAGGRPGYPDEMGHGRYEPGPRGDVPAPEATASHYANSGPPMGGPYAAQGAYPGAPYMHPAAAQQPPASRHYSTPGHTHAPEAYAPHGQPLSAGLHRPEGGAIDSRHQSPATPRQPQQHQQAPIMAAYPQSTPAVEARHSPATFQQGPMNGGYPPQYGALDARSRSPLMAQKNSDYRRNPAAQPAEPSGRHSMHEGGRFEPPVDSSRGSQAPPDYGRQNSTSSGGFGASSQPPRKGLHMAAGDGDGDVRMEDAQPAARRAILVNEEASLAPLAPMSAASAKSNSLPPVAVAAPAANASASALSGPTAAPIRLPPVQFGGSVASPGGRSSPLAASRSSSSSAPLGAAAGSSDSRRSDSRRSDSGGNTGPVGAPISLASAISAADDDKEGSAINSLMSLSGVASTLTSWPQQPPSMSASPQPSLPVAKSGSESVATAVGREQSTDAPAVTNGVKEMGISSPADEAGDDQAASRPVNVRSPIESGGRTHESSPLADRAGSSSDAAAVVPSKRSLSRTHDDADGDDGMTAPAGPLSPDGTGGGHEAPNDGGVGEPANNGPSRGAGTVDADVGGGEPWPRKRGRQGSPSPMAEKLLPHEARHGASPATDEVEEGEEPEDGEVFEDMPSGDGSKARKSDDIVMDSGKVTHD
ncbi:glucose repression mediator protein [Coemansia biformis]|uniref:Glucose repression mediator protein n=1 Tax=Coemansia biformis TaxID=1286918 RepID=A0A9W7YBV2_9FUNG|nr:glucose repression mediator protein [Coemansia biformis]